MVGPEALIGGEVGLKLYVNGEVRTVYVDENATPTGQVEVSLDPHTAQRQQLLLPEMTAVTSVPRVEAWTKGAMTIIYGKGAVQELQA